VNSIFLVKRTRQLLDLRLQLSLLICVYVTVHSSQAPLELLDAEVLVREEIRTGSTDVRQNSQKQILENRWLRKIDLKQCNLLL